MHEHFFQCPYCWEDVSFLLDTSISKTDYIEDCQVCCSPIEVFVEFKNNELQVFSSKSIEQ